MPPCVLPGRASRRVLVVSPVVPLASRRVMATSHPASGGVVGGNDPTIRDHRCPRVEGHRPRVRPCRRASTRRHVRRSAELEFRHCTWFHSRAVAAGVNPVHSVRPVWRLVRHTRWDLTPQPVGPRALSIPYRQSGHAVTIGDPRQRHTRSTAGWDPRPVATLDRTGCPRPRVLPVAKSQKVSARMSDPWDDSRIPCRPMDLDMRPNSYLAATLPRPTTFRGIGTTVEARRARGGRARASPHSDLPGSTPWSLWTARPRTEAGTHGGQFEVPAARGSSPGRGPAGGGATPRRLRRSRMPARPGALQR